MGPGRSDSRIVSVALPRNLPRGDQFLGLFADAKKRVIEDNEADNTRRLAVTCLGKPDLEASRLQMVSVVARGDKLKARVRLRNLGGAASALIVPWNIVLSKDDRPDPGDLLLFTENIPQFAPNEERVLEREASLPLDLDLQIYHVIATIDSSNTTNELDESNNRAHNQLRVVHRGRLARFGKRCAGSNGFAQQLARVVGGGELEIGRSVRFDVVAAASSRPALFVQGFSRRQWAGLTLPLALPGACEISTSLDLITAKITTALGASNQTIAIPSLRDLIGLRFFTQFLVSDPTANALGWTSSDAFLVEIGGQ